MSRHSWVREGSMGIWEADQSLTPNHPPRGRMLHSIVFLFTNIFLFFCHFARRYYSLVIISKCFKSGFHSWKLLICSDILRFFRSNTFWHKVNKLDRWLWKHCSLTHSLLTDRGLQVLWQAIASEKGVLLQTRWGELCPLCRAPYGSQGSSRSTQHALPACLIQRDKMDINKMETIQNAVLICHAQSNKI